MAKRKSTAEKLRKIHPPIEWIAGEANLGEELPGVIREILTKLNTHTQEEVEQALLTVQKTLTFDPYTPDAFVLGIDDELDPDQKGGAGFAELVTIQPAKLILKAAKAKSIPSSSREYLIKEWIKFFEKQITVLQTGLNPRGVR